MLTISNLVGFGVGGDFDPYFSSVVALLHFDGADASTTFTDVKGHTFTPSGDAQIDTAQSKFGGASGLFDGTGDYLTSADSSDWDIPGDFTMEFFIRPNALGGLTWVVCRGGNPTIDANCWGVFLNTDSKLYFTMNANEGGGYTLYTAATLSTSTWYHFVIQRISGVWEMFRDGVKETRTYSSSTSLDAATALKVGSAGDGSANFNGWMDELRITKGVARYSGNFSVPTAAYPDA